MCALIELTTFSLPQPFLGFDPSGQQSRAQPSLVFQPHDTTGDQPSIAYQGRLWRPSSTTRLCLYKLPKPLIDVFAVQHSSFNNTPRPILPLVHLKLALWSLLRASAQGSGRTMDNLHGKDLPSDLLEDIEECIL